MTSISIWIPFLYTAAFTCSAWRTVFWCTTFIKWQPTRRPHLWWQPTRRPRLWWHRPVVKGTFPSARGGGVLPFSASHDRDCRAASGCEILLRREPWLCPIRKTTQQQQLHSSQLQRDSCSWLGQLLRSLKKLRCSNLSKTEHLTLPSGTS